MGGGCNIDLTEIVPIVLGELSQYIPASAPEGSIDEYKGWLHDVSQAIIVMPYHGILT